MQIIRLRKAIPDKLVNAVSSLPQPWCFKYNLSLKIRSGCVTVHVMNASTNMIYDLLILRRCVTPSSVTRWSEVFDIDESDCPAIYKQPYIACRETK